MRSSAGSPDASRKRRWLRFGVATRKLSGHKGGLKKGFGMSSRMRFSGSVLFASALAATLAAGCGQAPTPLPLGGSDSLGGSSGNGATGSSSGGGGGGSAGTGTFGDGDSGTSMGVLLADAGCATGMSEASRQPVYLLFVLDGSGSMKQQNKWTAVVPALESIFTQMQSAADPGVAAGLIVFSDSNDPTMGGPYPSSADVPVAFVDMAHDTALASRLSGMPMSNTPTHAALTGGYGELEAYQAKSPVQSGGKKVLVLMTDGVPTDDCAGKGNYTTNACVELAAQKLKEASPMGPIETFVIGVGDFSSGSFFGALGIDPSFLGNLAQAGGTGAANCNPNETTSTTDLCYFEIDPSKSQTAMQLQQQFETALNAIRGQVVSCVYPLQSSNLTQVDPTHVNVTVGGMPILQDPNNGWTYDNPAAPTEIILHGTSCATVKGNLTVKVSIVLGCATQIAK